MLIRWALRQNLLQGMRKQNTVIRCWTAWFQTYCHWLKTNCLSRCQSIKLNKADIQHTEYQPCLVQKPKTWSIRLVASIERSTRTNQATVCWWMKLPWKTEKRAQLTVHGMHSDPENVAKDLSLWASHSGHVHTAFQACYCLRMAKSGLASVALT